MTQHIQQTLGTPVKNALALSLVQNDWSCANIQPCTTHTALESCDFSNDIILELALAMYSLELCGKDRRIGENYKTTEGKVLLSVFGW